MIKHILFALFLCIPMLTSAQFKKGDKLMGGTFDYHSTHFSHQPAQVNPSDYYTISAFPSLGFFISEKTAVGGLIGLEYQNNRLSILNNLSHSSVTSLSTGAFIKRFFSMTDKFLFSLNGDLSFSRHSHKLSGRYDNAPILTHSYNSYELGTTITPSFLFLPSPRWGLEASFGSANIIYFHTLPDGFRTTRFNIDYGSVSLGLYYFLRKKD